MNLKRPLSNFLLLMLLVSATGTTACQTVWLKAQRYDKYKNIDLSAPIMTTDQYDKIIKTHARPYVVSIKAGKGALLLYGASHTKDPKNKQISDIKNRFLDFKPTVVLVEGRLGFFYGDMEAAIKKFGENGLLYFLAKQENITAYTWETSIEIEVASVLKKHDKKRVALYYILRPYFSNLRHGKPADPDSKVEGTRGRRTQIKGLENTFESVKDIDQLWQQDFKGKPDWRDTSDEYDLPGYLKTIMADSNAARDEHFARVIIDLVRKGERVFAMAGSSHAVKLDKTLQTSLVK